MGDDGNTYLSASVRGGRSFAGVGGDIPAGSGLLFFLFAPVLSELLRLNAAARSGNAPVCADNGVLSCSRSRSLGRFDEK